MLKVFILFVICILQSHLIQGHEDPMQNLQQQLKKEILQEIKETSYLTGVSSVSPSVWKAFMEVPRHRFMDSSQEEMAYINSAFPIGHGQTISQPYIVVLMTELLEVKKTDRLLEIGTGSGYQAAILSKLASKVYTIEIIPQLAQQAEKCFQASGYKNIFVLIGQGREGWSKYAPYNKIIVTAAAEEIPQELLNQLKPGGRMVIPIGAEGKSQILTLVKKDEKGHISQKAILPVVFVPFRGEHDQ